RGRSRKVADLVELGVAEPPQDDDMPALLQRVKLPWRHRRTRIRRPGGVAPGKLHDRRFEVPRVAVFVIGVVGLGRALELADDLHDARGRGWAGLLARH